MKQKFVLVLIHGWGMHAAFWKPVVPMLEERFAVHAVELPGHGMQTDQPFPASLKALVDCVMEQCPSSRPLIVLGWSLGGLVAIGASLYHPEQVARLVLVGATPCFTADEGSGWEGLDDRFLDEFERRLEKNYKKALQRLLMLLVYGEPQNRQMLCNMQALLALAPVVSRDALLKGLRLLRCTDLRNAMKNIHQPTLLLAGEHDYFTKKEALKKTHASLPSAKMAIMHAAGHAPFVSNPKAFVKTLNKFMDS